MTFARRMDYWWRENQLKVLTAFVLLLFVVLIFWHRIFYVIPAGHAGVYYSLFFGGTLTSPHSVRGEGLKIVVPWDHLTIYDTRIQEVSHEFSVITNDGLRVDVEVSIRYKPKLKELGYLQKNIGEDYVRKIVLPESLMALRGVIGQKSPEQIYSTNIEVLQRSVIQAISEVAQKHVKIDDILITKIELPPSLKEAIESKLSSKQKSLAYDYLLVSAKKEAERKRIEAEGVRDFQNIVAEGISPALLKWRGIEATLELSKSPNSKVVIIGSGKSGLPIILNTDPLSDAELKKFHSTKPTPAPDFIDPSSKGKR